METATHPPLTPPLATSTGARNWSVLCHATALCGFFIPALGHFIGPLLVWLLKREQYPEVNLHGKESLNFQISLFLYAAAIFALCFVLIGLFLLPLLGLLHILNVVFVIIASIRASEGKPYRYPLTMRFLK